MILALTTVEDSTIRRLLEDPEQVWRVLAPDDPEMHPARPMELAAGESNSTDLDKAWHGIHYLLTGTEWEGTGPAAFLLAGGKEVGDVDVGYGPARALSASEVRAAHEHLAGLGDAELRSRFDPADMMEKDIYPTIWDRASEDDDTLGYLMEFVGILRSFLAETVARKRGLLIHIG
jgi:hypothetical protein